ncbi:hypothetical protein MC885_004558, partial [Smutsia gigantea]
MMYTSKVAIKNKFTGIKCEWQVNGLNDIKDLERNWEGTGPERKRDYTVAFALCPGHQAPPLRELRWPALAAEESLAGKIEEDDTRWRRMFAKVPHACLQLTSDVKTG